MIPQKSWLIFPRAFSLIFAHDVPTYTPRTLPSLIFFMTLVVLKYTGQFNHNVSIFLLFSDNQIMNNAFFSCLYLILRDPNTSMKI